MKNVKEKDYSCQNTDRKRNLQKRVDKIKSPLVFSIENELTKSYKAFNIELSGGKNGACRFYCIGT